MTFNSLRFDRAAGTYDAHAQVQAAMAETLIGLWPSPQGPHVAAAGQPARTHGGGNPVSVPGAPAPTQPADGKVSKARLLEMGCGTGLFTRKLLDHFRGGQAIVTDAAPRMLAAARVNAVQAVPEESALRVDWELFDASGEARIPDPVARAAPYALAASAAMVQWFPRLETHFRMVRSLVAPGGAYLVSGFTRDNFPELNAILAGPPFAYPDYPGHDAAGIRASAEAAGFAVEAFREDTLETAAPTARAFLESIRGMGSARRPESGKPLTRGRLAFLLDRYQERYPWAAGRGNREGNPGQGGVRATWKPWYALLRARPAG